MSFANTPEGKAQAKRLTECRLALGCKSAKDFFNRYSNGLFSYPQYQKYESGEDCSHVELLFFMRKSLMLIMSGYKMAANRNQKKKLF